MPVKIENVIDTFITEVSKMLNNRLKKIILYGSYARGEQSENSDIDIMILTDLNDEELIEYRGKIRDLACDIEMENDVIISPLVRNIEMYNKRVNVIPFYHNVQSEGVILLGWRNKYL